MSISKIDLEEKLNTIKRERDCYFKMYETEKEINAQLKITVLKLSDMKTVYEKEIDKYKTMYNDLLKAVKKS